MAGFQHWLGSQELAEAADAVFCDAIYPALRLGEPEAKRLVARRFMRMAFSLCSRYAMTYWDTDELVAEALLTLVESVEMISKGALDHHVPKPNIGGYINMSIYGSLNKIVTRRLGVNEKTFRKHGGRTPRLVFTDSQAWITDSKSAGSIVETREIMELMEQSMKLQEREVFNLRMQGNSDFEIAEMLGLSRQRIQQIRADLKVKLAQILD